MSCNCAKIKDLPTCIDELIIGTISLLSQDVFVFFKNTSIDYTVRLTGVSDGDGLVTIDLSALNNFFSPNYSYDIWITAEDESPTSKQDITYDTYTFYDCLSAKFFRIEDSSMEAIYYSTVTAELE